MFFKQNADRRSFLGALGAAVGALATPFRLAGKSAPFTPPPVNITGFGSTGNVYEALGVTTVINGEGTMTVLGGALMRPEVEALMSLAGRHFVPAFIDAAADTPPVSHLWDYANFRKWRCSFAPQ